MYILPRFLAAAGAAVLAGGALQASGYATSITSRDPGMDIAALVEAVKDYLKDANAYDPDIPDACVLYTTTTDGGSCYASLTCSDNSEMAEFTGWNVCYLGGLQYFSDPRIGDFMITFTQAGGVNSDEDGLHHPVFQFRDFNHWEPWDVTELYDQMGDGDEGNLCWKHETAGTRLKEWKCGIPRLGGSTVFGHSLIGDDDNVDGGYKPGWCTGHVVQYQRNEYGNGDKFAFDITLYDGEQNQIAHIQHQEVDDTNHLSMTSPLPWTLELWCGPGDADTVGFCYADQCWTCDDTDGGPHDCTIGNGKEDGYENGDREGDFGFTC